MSSRTFRTPRVKQATAAPCTTEAYRDRRNSHVPKSALRLPSPLSLASACISWHKPPMKHAAGRLTSYVLPCFAVSVVPAGFGKPGTERACIVSDEAKISKLDSRHRCLGVLAAVHWSDRKSTRLNSSHPS